MPSLRDEVVQVLAENGLAQTSDSLGNLHSWRCDYPERFGPCNCLGYLADDLVRVLEAASPDQADATSEGDSV